MTPDCRGSAESGIARDRSRPTETKSTYASIALVSIITAGGRNFEIIPIGTCVSLPLSASSLLAFVDDRLNAANFGVSDSWKTSMCTRHSCTRGGIAKYCANLRGRRIPVCSKREARIDRQPIEWIRVASVAKYGIRVSPLRGPSAANVKDVGAGRRNDFY